MKFLILNASLMSLAQHFPCQWISASHIHTPINKLRDRD